MTAEACVVGDWGSTRLRLWLREAGNTVARVESPGLLAADDEPAKVLRAALGRLGRETEVSRVTLCGMAGARGGLANAGYVACPGSAEDWVDAAVATVLDTVPVAILPGFSNRDRQGRPDVMRGEETQVFGALARCPIDDAEGANVLLPGTHSKWVRVSRGRIMSFATCPTGELHARLRGSSLAPLEADDEGEPYTEGLSAGLARAREAGPLISSLFEARAAQMLDGLSGVWAVGFLSGLLIGNEIAAMTQSGERSGPCWLVSSGKLATLYRAALDAFGLDCHVADGEDCAIAGLEMAHARLG